MPDDVTTRAIAERLQRWSRTMVLGVDTFTSLTRMAEAADAVSTRLLKELPPTDTDISPPFDAWSFIRDVLSRGSLLAGEAERGGWGYEQLSARMDKLAREYADRLKPHLRATP